MYQITKKNFLTLLKRQMQENEIIAPTRTGKDVAFNIITDVDEIVFDFKNVVKPAKDFFIPHSEEILKFDKGSIKPNFENKKRIMFGIRTCDLMGLQAMDPTFNEVSADPHYFGKRENTTLISFGCTQNCDSNAFCDSMYGHIAKKGFDIQVIPLEGDSYFIEYGSEKGKDLIGNNLDLLVKPDTEMFERVKSLKTKKINTIGVDCDKFYDQLNLGKFNDIDFWKKFSRTCLRCGGCNYLCPSCFCNNIADRKSGRIRSWDSCMLRGFTREAGGVIPRQMLFTRLRQRMFHKYKWHKERYGMNMCTGCGRCITYCPGKVPYLEIINDKND